MLFLEIIRVFPKQTPLSALRISKHINLLSQKKKHINLLYIFFLGSIFKRVPDEVLGVGNESA